MQQGCSTLDIKHAYHVSLWPIYTQSKPDGQTDRQLDTVDRYTGKTHQIRQTDGQTKNSKEQGSDHYVSDCFRQNLVYFTVFMPKTN